jgi:hypothetical protein
MFGRPLQSSDDKLGRSLILTKRIVVTDDPAFLGRELYLAETVTKQWNHQEMALFLLARRDNI